MSENPPSLLASVPLSFADSQRNARLAWRIIWRSKYLVLACLMLGLLPTILFLQQATPRYSAEAKIMVQAAETNDVLSDRAPGMGRAMLNESVMATEVELIGSQTLARQVVTKLKLDRDPEFNRKLAKPQAIEVFFASLNPLSWLQHLSSSRNDPTQALGPAARETVERDAIANVLLAGLKVAAQRRSYIISIQYTSQEPEKAALIANTFAEMYVLDRLEASFEEARRISVWLGSRLEALQKDVVATEGAVEHFRSEHNLRLSTDRRATINDQPD